MKRIISFIALVLSLSMICSICFTSLAAESEQPLSDTEGCESVQEEEFLAVNDLLQNLLQESDLSIAEQEEADLSEPDRGAYQKMSLQLMCRNLQKQFRKFRKK